MNLIQVEQTPVSVKAFRPNPRGPAGALLESDPHGAEVNLPVVEAYSS